MDEMNNVHDQGRRLPLCRCQGDATTMSMGKPVPEHSIEKVRPFLRDGSKSAGR